jgi:hypothetical protein
LIKFIYLSLISFIAFKFYIYFSFEILSIFKTFISSSNALISCPDGTLPKIPGFTAGYPILVKAINPLLVNAYSLYAISSSEGNSILA